MAQGFDVDPVPKHDFNHSTIGQGKPCLHLHSRTCAESSAGNPFGPVRHQSDTVRSYWQARGR